MKITLYEERKTPFSLKEEDMVRDDYRGVFFSDPTLLWNHQPFIQGWVELDTINSAWPYPYERVRTILGSERMNEIMDQIEGKKPWKE